MSASEPSNSLEKCLTPSPVSTCGRPDEGMIEDSEYAPDTNTETHSVQTGALVETSSKDGYLDGSVEKMVTLDVGDHPCPDSKRLNDDLVGVSQSPKRGHGSNTSAPHPEAPPTTLLKPPVTTASVSRDALSSSLPQAKVMADTVPLRSSTPLMVGARVIPRASSAPSGSGQAACSLVSVSQSGLLSVRPAPPKMTPQSPAPGRGAMLTIQRTAAPQQGVAMSRAPQTGSLQLPANLQIPRGMVLIRSDGGQLMLVSPQALAQAHTQSIVLKPSTVTAGGLSSPQVSATGSPVIRVSVPLPCAAPTNVQKTSSSTVIKPGSATGTTVLKPCSTTGTTILKPCSATGTTVLKPCSTTGTTVLKPCSATGTTVLKPCSATGTTILKPCSATGTTVSKPCSATGTTVSKPCSATGTTVSKPGSTTGTIVKVASSSSSAGMANQKSTSVTGITVQNPKARPGNAALVKTVARAIPSPAVNQTVLVSGNAPRVLSPNIPTRSPAAKATPTAPVTAETLENVKKCKNFLVTLMKLASSDSRSADMAQNVRSLVKNLLDGKLEAEEFTDKLYMELRSSPQPCLVSFLKRNLPAVRQFTPNSLLFIQQCDAPKPPASAPTQAATSTSTSTLKPTPSSSTPQPVALQQTARPTQLILQQQQRSMVVRQPVTSSSSSSSSSPSQVILPQPKHLIIQTHTLPTGAVLRQSSLQVSKTVPSQAPPAGDARCFKDSAAGSFREEDDINDVTSMAGVNLREENARILAVGSELVGAVIRSCPDEPFLQPAALHRRILDTGRALGVEEVGSGVLSLLSQATQERLQDLLEKLTVIARHRNTSYRDDWQHRQTNDTQAQLKFLEELDRLEKQRKDNEERETLLRIAKSRSNSEDPEQQRLRQRAKEMHQLELAQMQTKAANLAALAALGPRKRRPLERSEPGASQLSVGGVRRAAGRPHTRVTVRDLIFCLEQDCPLRRSLTLYKALLQ